jgi:carbonic anhydrase/acetyltransferase-like protein (isoleucine patch superfamily)
LLRCRDLRYIYQEMPEFSRILETSSFLSLCRNLREPGGSVFPNRKLRNLKGAEIRTLLKQGNIATDWGDIRVLEDFSPLRVYGSFFLGPCILGVFAQNIHHIGKAAFPSGIFYSSLSNVIVGDEAFIHRCPLVSRCVVDAEASLADCRIEGEESSSFGNGSLIGAGIETGGRRVPVFYDLDPAVAEEAARGSIDPRQLEEFLADYARAACLPASYVGKKSVIHGAGLISASFIGPGVRIEGAARVRGSTVCGGEGAEAEIGAGCLIDDTVIRPGCRFDSQALASRCFFADCSGALRQAKVTESWIGPNTTIAEGEVTSAFVGPFVSFHHQSLLIAAFWPGGRGNIGQGANVGSNHSSRTADGELWAGEGMFFGLGCNIKYPADYSRSPYTIIATGVTALPQKVEYPFSLIVPQENRDPGISPACNRIVPAWVLSDNFYLVERSKRKFAQRDRTPRLKLEFDPLHEGVIHLMEDARKRLASVTKVKDVYLPGDIPGIGGNILLEKDRLRAIQTYDWFIRFACLRDLFRPPCGGETAETPAPELAKEYCSCLDRLYGLVVSSRQKDTRLGEKIIPDYAGVHAPAEADECVAAVKDFTEAEKKRVEALCACGGGGF